MKYRTIVADPPWEYPEGFAQADGPGRHLQYQVRSDWTPPPIARKELPYGSMTVEQIIALPVSAWAERDARLFLWTTNRHLPDAFEVCSAWGFTYRQLVVWDKRPNVNPLGGSIAPNSAEYLLVAARGGPGRLVRWDSCIVQTRKARAHHSAKPDAFIDLIEQVSPGPYLEMFARRARFGWDYWGDQSLNTAEVAA